MTIAIHKPSGVILDVMPTEENWPFGAPDLAEWLIDPTVPDVPRELWEIAGDAVIEKAGPEADAIKASLLSRSKYERKAAIDGHTRFLIGEGFDHLGIRMSLSHNAQMNILGLYGARAAPVGGYPVSLSSKDNTQILVLANAPDVEAFHDAAFGFIRAVKEQGALLKDAIENTTTQAELDAIVDTR